MYYKALKVIVYITSKCLFVFNKAIFTYIFGWFLMNFTQKLATYVTFRFQFVVQFLAFTFVVSGANNFIDTLETTSTFCSLIFNLWAVVYFFLDILNTSHFVVEFDLKDVRIFKSSLNTWEDKSFSKLIRKLKIGNLDVIVSEDCFSIGSACVQYKSKCIQRPSLWFVSGWMICWQEITNINSNFQMIIHYMYVRFLPLIIGDLDLVMHSRKDDHILLTRLLLVNVWHKHHVFHLVVDIGDWLFFSIVDGFQLLWYSLSIMPHGTHNCELFLQSPFCQRHGSKVPVKRNNTGNARCYCNWVSCWLNTGCKRRYQLHSI